MSSDLATLEQDIWHFAGYELITWQYCKRMRCVLQVDENYFMIKPLRKSCIVLFKKSWRAPKRDVFSKTAVA